MLTFHVEKWAPFYTEAEPLMHMHYAEIALDQDLFKADMDDARYQAMEDSGVLHIVAARSWGKLVGYSISFIMPHFHYKSSGLIALADMYWIHPDHRRGGAGAKLMIFMVERLKELGVRRSHISCKVHQDHTKLFEKLGWKLTDYTFSRILCQ